ncbi:MAG: glutathione S-transferase family protein [Alphaproteobacteria bacterium]|nr:glutathione S-transferase family protein [Alphaproteobacteria bacterium]
MELFTARTSNGLKARILLEEAGFPYRAHRLDLRKGDQRRESFLHINPFGKIPVIVDPEGPGGQPKVVVETLAIAFYLSEKSGLMGPRTALESLDFLEWSSAMASGLAPSLRAHYRFTEVTPTRDEAVLAYHLDEIRRFLDVADQRLRHRDFLAGDRFTLLDALFFPSLVMAESRLAGGLSGLDRLARYRVAIATRPAVARAIEAHEG